MAPLSVGPTPPIAPRHGGIPCGFAESETGDTKTSHTCHLETLGVPPGAQRGYLPELGQAGMAVKSTGALPLPDAAA